MTNQSMTCVSSGKPGINLVFANDTTAPTLLTTGKVNATFQDSTDTDFIIHQNPGLFVSCMSPRVTIHPCFCLSLFQSLYVASSLHVSHSRVNCVQISVVVHCYMVNANVVCSACYQPTTRGHNVSSELHFPNEHCDTGAHIHSSRRDISPTHRKVGSHARSSRHTFQLHNTTDVM